MKEHTVPVLPGDGIGPEIIAEGMKVLEATAAVHGFRIKWAKYPHGADHYLATGELISLETLRELSQYKAIYFGASGDDRIPPGVLERGVVLAIRFYFDQYINLRPVRLLEGVETSLRKKTTRDIDFVVVRENTEDFYIGAGGRCKKGKTEAELEITRQLYRITFGLEINSDSSEVAYQLGFITREGARRVFCYAFELARKRKKHLSLVDKANILTEIYSLWREEFDQVARGYPDVKTDYNFVDATSMWFVKNPEFFDVVVMPNMFGDILTDLGAMIQGGLGLAPGGNINPQGTSMFEAIHGSATKYKGLNKVNPIATIWAGALLLEFLGEQAAAGTVVKAIEKNLKEGRVQTYDLGGSSKTSDVGDDIARLIQSGV